MTYPDGCGRGEEPSAMAGFVGGSSSLAMSEDLALVLTPFLCLSVALLLFPSLFALFSSIKSEVNAERVMLSLGAAVGVACCFSHSKVNG